MTPSVDRDAFCARSGSTRRARSCCISAPRRSSRRTRSGFVRRVGRGDPRQRRPAAAQRRAARPAAPAERRAVARRGSAVRVRERGGVAEGGRQPDWRRRARRLFRLDVSRRSRGRREHQRHDRVGHHRPARSTRCRWTEFAATQDGTLHFQHLKNVDGGLLHLAPTLDEHVAQLARLPSEGEAGRQKARRVHPGVRPPARAGRGRDAARRRRQSSSSPPRRRSRRSAAPAAARVDAPGARARWRSC